MLDLDACRTFARVVETHSFSEAARSLGMSLPVVSKQVARLEQQLGTRLLNRTTRHLSLSEAGAAFHAHCVQLLDIAQTAEAAVSQFHQTPRGHLRVSAPVAFANGSLAPLLPTFLERYPDVQLELDASDRQVDLAEDGFDLAIRLTARPPDGLVARPLHRIRRVACAADAYLQRRGTPQTPQDLAQHNCLIYSQSEGAGTWAFEQDGRVLVVPVRGSFRSNSTEALRRAACGGVGVAYMRDYAVRQNLLDGSLREVLAAYAPPSRAELFALYLPNRYLPPKVRVFIDYLVGCFDQP